MNILALNFGSATLKYALFAPDGTALLQRRVVRPASVREALLEVSTRVAQQGGRLAAIGHRVVHAGRVATGPVLFDTDTERAIEAASPLAPLHNAVALEGLRVGRVLWPQVPQAAVFDTAFHAGMPEHASTYAVPARWRRAGLRRYGFHGLSHRNVMEASAARLGRDPAQLRIVSCHLGHGASVCAIDRGRSVDTSMGLTPLEGLIMGTRCGDLDPGAAAFIARELQLPTEEIDRQLREESGLAALAGQGGDMRRIQAAAEAGDAAAALAVRSYAYRLRKYIGAYAAAMGGCDAVAFTGGVGENSPAMRAMAIQPLGFLGVALEPALNQSPAIDSRGVAELQAAGSRAAVLLVQAREEWLIFRETQWMLGGGR